MPEIAQYGPYYLLLNFLLLPNSAEGNRAKIIFVPPLHLKGLIILFWEPFNGQILGVGTKSGCGFFISKSKMASKMAAKKMNFLFFP